MTLILLYMNKYLQGKYILYNKLKYFFKGFFFNVGNGCDARELLIREQVTMHLHNASTHMYDSVRKMNIFNIVRHLEIGILGTQT